MIITCALFNIHIQSVLFIQHALITVLANKTLYCIIDFPAGPVRSGGVAVGTWTPAWGRTLKEHSAAWKSSSMMTGTACSLWRYSSWRWETRAGTGVELVSSRWLFMCQSQHKPQHVCHTETTTTFLHYQQKCEWCLPMQIKRTLLKQVADGTLLYSFCHIASLIICINNIYSYCIWFLS